MNYLGKSGKKYVIETNGSNGREKGVDYRDHNMAKGLAFIKLIAELSNK